MGASGEGGGEEMYKDGWGSRARSVDARQSPGRDAGRSSSLDSIVYFLDTPVLSGKNDEQLWDAKNIPITKL